MLVLKELEELVKKFGAIKTEEGKTQEGRWWGGHRPNKDDKRLNFRIYLNWKRDWEIAMTMFHFLIQKWVQLD